MGDVARFWQRVDLRGPVHPELGTRCQLWTKGTDANGYGILRWRGTVRTAHRVALELAGVVVPADHDSHHRCGVKRCVRADHLEVLSHAEHARISNLQETCIHGHNRWGVIGEGRRAAGRRYCLECLRQRTAERRRRAA